MRIAFVVVGNVNRSGDITGEKIRYEGSSCSGTESSVVYVSEYLSSIGHDVTVALEFCKNPQMSNGVFYTNLLFDEVKFKEYDVLVTCLWFDGYKNLPIKVKKSVIYWYHLAWGYAHNSILEYASVNKLSIGSVSISNWAFGENKQYNDLYKNHEYGYHETIIPNAIDTNLIKNILDKNIPRKKHKVIFSGQWSRGGDVAEESVRNLNWTDLEFVHFDYINHEKTALDKSKLYYHLAESNYFIFPSLTHRKLVYQDTFSVSIAEALALGVNVVTYPFGAIPEYYGHHCHFIKFPDGLDIDTLKKSRVFEAPQLTETKHIVDLVNHIDSKDVSVQHRFSQFEYINQQFNINKIGNMWNLFIDKLCNNKV